jgi:myo-inositol-1-phosphate synthase
MPKKIRVALMGVGNSASIFVQGLTYFQKNGGEASGLWHPNLGGQNISDIEIAEAFDINPAKVGHDLGEAIFTKPNTVKKYVNAENLGVTVRKGTLLEPLPKDVAEMISAHEGKGEDIAAALKASGVDVVLNLIPSGLDKTSKAYADAALQAGCSFINCTPSPIARDPAIAAAFSEKGLLVVGDDLMSQFGGTAFHRGILEFMESRGIRSVKSYQLDVGGGAETLNTVDERNKMVKREIKTSAIASEVPYNMEIVTGTTEYVDYMENDRTSYYWILGEGFLGAPVKMDIYLRTSDGPNAANILFDAVRAVQASQEKSRYGAPDEICGYGFKKPPKNTRLDNAYRAFSEAYLNT